MEYLNSLNTNQLHAVTTISKKVLVIAGAGSGKTKVLTERIKYLLDNGTNPNQIVAFTFTKRAAKEMEYRLKSYNFTNIYTFHSYCYKLLSINKDFLGFNKFNTIRIVTDDYEYKIIDDILTDLNITYNQRLIKDYISKRKNQIPYKFKSTKEESLLNTIYYKFQEYMSSRGEIDFDDMISIITTNLDNLPTKQDILNECKYILVDECQDTNQIQYNLITKLSSLHNNIFMVGDEDQLIYTFRSSNIEIINHFKQITDETIILNQNYRSSKNILDLSNNLISNNLERTPKHIYSTIPTKYEIKIEDFQDTTQQSIFISSKIKTLLKTYKPNDIAVLFRNNYQSDEIEYHLKRNNIPFTTYGKRKFFQYDEIKRLIYLYQFLEDQTNYILFRQAFPIDESIYHNLISQYKQSNKSLLDYLISINHQTLTLISQRLKEILSKRNQYNKSSLFNALTNLLFDDNKTKIQNHLNTFKDLIVNNELEHEIDIINELMLNDIDDDSLGVNLMTIHKSKGLEFKCVFIISVNNGIIPPSLKDPKSIEEERRLLYVAITRAKEYLFISSTEYNIINGIRKKLKPSVFLSELK